MKFDAPTPSRSVLIWLIIVYLMVLAMVAVGGITRLTGSGLSMTEWHPLMGWIPPLSEEGWIAVFDLYKESPQYQQVNTWMNLGDFKQIFFWEYVHRVLGRTIGSVFLWPWLFFVWRGFVQGAWVWRTFLAFVLGGLQGILGWFMVQSGLTDVPEVSHFRLAAHLSLAFIVGAYVLWLVMDIVWPRVSTRAHFLYRWGLGLLAILSLQIVYGAFMAGKKAGLLYPSFPDFLGQWFPSAAWTMAPTWLNLFENPHMIHAIHRWLGWVVAIVGISLGMMVWRQGTSIRQRRLGVGMVAVVLGQFALGVLTILSYVSLWTAVSHQVMGFILMSIAVALLHGLRDDSP